MIDSGRIPMNAVDIFTHTFPWHPGVDYHIYHRSCRSWVFKECPKLQKDSDISINLNDKSLVTWETGRIIVNSKNTHRGRFDGEKDHFSRRRLHLSTRSRQYIETIHKRLTWSRRAFRQILPAQLGSSRRDSRPKNIVCQNVYSYSVSRSLGLGVFPMSNVMV